MSGISGIPAGLKRLKKTGFNPTRILDIGAYEGWFARIARETWPEARIYCVEAMSERAHSLNETINTIGNAEYMIALLGSKDGEKLDFFIAHGGDGDKIIQTGSSLYREKTGVLTERKQLLVTTLDKLIDEKIVYEFLKLDVQGAELDVLKGAKFILNTVEFILLEISILEYNDGAPLILDVINYMNEIDFVVFDIVDLARHGEYLNQIDVVFIRREHPLRHRFLD